MLAPAVLRLLERATGGNAKSYVSEAPGDLQRASASLERLVQSAEQCVEGRHGGAGPAAPALVVQPLGEGVGLQQALERPRDFAELHQGLPQLETDLEAHLQGGFGLLERPHDAESLVKIGPGIVGC